MIVAFWNFVETILLYSWGTIVLLTFLLIPFIVSEIILNIIFHKMFKKDNYILRNLIAFLLVLNGFFYLNSGVFNDFFPPVAFIIFESIILFVHMRSSIYTRDLPFYNYLSNVLTVSYIQSPQVRVFCIILGGILVLITWSLLADTNIFIIMILILVAYFPFIVACLIKARLCLSIIRKFFHVPHAPYVSSPDKEDAFINMFVWVNKKELCYLKKISEKDSRGWRVYIPAVIIFFYLITIYLSYMWDLWPLNIPHLIGLWITGGVLLIIGGLGKKLSFIAAPLAFVLIVLSLLQAGGSFGLAEAAFLVLVFGSSITNLRFLSVSSCDEYDEKKSKRGVTAA